MKDSTRNIISRLCSEYPILKANDSNIITAVEALVTVFENGNKLLVCGNGGSAADSLHIVGELMKGFVLSRRINDELRSKIVLNCSNGKYIANNLQYALPAISLVNEVSLQTAYANDMAPDLCFAQQVFGYGKKGDALIAISTSGNSKNMIYSCEIAKVMGIKVIGLTGLTGGKMKSLCDILINVSETETYKIQELHLPVYHALCLAVENEFFGI